MYLVYLPLVLVLVRRLDRDVATDDVSAKPVESFASSRTRASTAADGCHVSKSDL